MSGAGRSTAANVLEDLGWFVVDNLPPALLPTMVELGGRAQGDVPAHRGRRRRTQPGVLRRPPQALAAARDRRRQPADRLPRGLRRRAGAPVRGGPPTAPAAGRRAARRRHRRASASCCATCAATPTSSSTPPTSTCTSCAPRCCRRSTADGRTGLHATRDLLRLQVRPAGRRRPRRRLPVPAQPALGAGAAAADRPRRAGARLRARAARRRRSSSTATATCSRSSAAGYLREGKRYVTVAVGCTGGKHRCVAMAEELAPPAARRTAWTSPSSHRDLGRE